MTAASDNTFHIMVRADCEATGHSVADPALGRRAVQGMADICAAFSIPLTLYVIPTDLEADASLYRDALPRPATKSVFTSTRPIRAGANFSACTVLTISVRSSVTPPTVSRRSWVVVP